MQTGKRKLLIDRAEPRVISDTYTSICITEITGKDQFPFLIKSDLHLYGLSLGYIA
jgi:hypothetical protein